MKSVSRRSQNRWRAVSAVLIALALASAAATSFAQDENWGYLLPHELMSPYCPGRTLAQCTSPQAAELRQWILLQEASGATRVEVEEMLFDKFGDIILSAPRAEGAWGISAYALPAVFFVIGGPVVFLVLRRLKGGAAKAEPASSAAVVDSSVASVARSDSELERLVEQELASH